MRRRTTLDVTAPLRFPHPIAIPRVALRLYEPSTLLDTHALVRFEIEISSELIRMNKKKL